VPQCLQNPRVLVVSVLVASRDSVRGFGGLSEKWGLIDMKLATVLSALLLAAGSVTACSCGLLFQGTTEEINVASEPKVNSHWRIAYCGGAAGG
jgi:predicted small secreted protein